MAAKIDPVSVARGSAADGPCRFTAEVDQITEPGWNALFEGFADASVYQSWAYGAVCWGERQLSHLVLRRGGSPVALAQLRIVRVPVLRSGVAYLRWGPVCVPAGAAWDPAVWRAMTKALIDEYAVRRRLLLRVIPNLFAQDPAAEGAAGICSQLGLREDTAVRKYRTMRVDLSPPADVLRSRLSSRWRRQLNIAGRNGLKIVEGRTDDLYRQFLELYGQMMARKQFDTTVDPRDFMRIQERLPISQKMTTFICTSGGQPVAGLVVDAVGTTASYLLAATGDKGLHVRGSYLLQWRAMERLKEQGREWYDLGGINPEINPGVFTFKSGMGGGEVWQLGRYHLSRSRLSSVSVFAGERIRRMAGKLARRP